MKDEKLDPQEEFWQRFGETAKAQAEYQRVKRDFESFLDEHPDQTFLVFRPEEVERALKNDVLPLLG